MARRRITLKGASETFSSTYLLSFPSLPVDIEFLRPSPFLRLWMNTPHGNNRPSFPTVARLMTVTCRPSLSKSGLRSPPSLPDVKSIQPAMDTIRADRLVDQYNSEFGAGCASVPCARHGRWQYTTSVGGGSVASRYVAAPAPEFHAHPRGEGCATTSSVLTHRFLSRKRKRPATLTDSRPYS